MNLHVKLKLKRSFFDQDLNNTVSQYFVLCKQLIDKLIKLVFADTIDRLLSLYSKRNKIDYTPKQYTEAQSLYNRINNHV